MKKNKNDAKNRAAFYQYDLKKKELPVIPVIAELTTTGNKKLAALINGIYLHIYPDDIGILVIETSNRSDDEAIDSTLDSCFYARNNIVGNGADLLLFNNMFRRVYPTYFEKGEEGFDEQKKSQELPGSINIPQLQINAEFDLTLTRLEKTSSGAKRYPVLSHHITKLIDGFFDTETSHGTKPEYYPILDDRMLVHSYVAFPEDIVGSVVKKARDIFFSQFLYVDNPNSTYRYNEAFIEPLMVEQSYTRWAHFNTKIGFTRYSSAFQYAGHAGYLYRPFVSMYYQMFLLITYYRARLVRFSDDVADIAEAWPSSGEDKLSRADKYRLRRLHTRFMRFMNIYWFREVTNQDQGIEIFRLMRKSFDIDSMYMQVKDEIERADELAELLHNEKVERFNRYAGWIGISIGLSAILTGFFGMNFEMIGGENGWGGIQWLFYIVLSVTGLSPLIVYRILKTSEWLAKRKANKQCTRSYRIRDLAGEDTLFLELYQTEESLYLFPVAGSEPVRVVKMDFSAREGMELVQSLMEALGANASRDIRSHPFIRGVRQPLAQLFDLLIAPLKPLLQRFKRLIIAPHLFWHYLPFHALYDGAEKAYLCDRMEIGYCPSASFARAPPRSC